MTPEELQRRLHAGEPLFILDIREVQEYRQGHIPGAHLIPLWQLPVRLQDVPRDAEVVTVCRSGRRSAQAAAILRTHGYRVRNLRGGMLNWKGPTAR
ncbi:MAG: rhodanese-like domain-containing protein [Firmicutes bacterium]|nr:rhodanese-like domain-containing protein [Bacillota bacterium]